MKNAGTVADYDQWHDELHGGESSSIELAQWHESALDLARSISGTVLEVGCGRGDFAISLAQRGGRVTAVDFSETAIHIARQKALRFGQDVNFDVANATSLPFADESFDQVFSCECLEHVPDPSRMLTEIFRVLKPGGSVILSTENYSNGMTLLWMQTWLTGKPFNSGAGVQPIEHYFLFWQVKKMFEKAGFKVRQMVGSHHVFLVLPRFHPRAFVKEKFASPFWATFFKPLARHVTFLAEKPKR
jgi:ubiquinone biosynthesis O-methyltransferase